MADDGEIIFPTRADRRELERIRDKVDGVGGDGVFSTPNATAVVPGSRANYEPAVGEQVMVRINANLTGQGKYQGYILNPWINEEVAGTNVGSTKNVFIGETVGQVDGEFVIIWNANETDSNPGSPVTGTNRSHLLPSGVSYTVFGRIIGSELYESSTSRVRVVLVETMPAFNCNV